MPTRVHLRTEFDAAIHDLNRLRPKQNLTTGFAPGSDAVVGPCPRARHMERSMTSSASTRAARSAFSLAATALMSSPRVLTPVVPVSRGRVPKSIRSMRAANSASGTWPTQDLVRRRISSERHRPQLQSAVEAGAAQSVSPTSPQSPHPEN
jgi:hypothetical protein